MNAHQRPAILLNNIKTSAGALTNLPIRGKVVSTKWDVAVHDGNHSGSRQPSSMQETAAGFPGSHRETEISAHHGPGHGGPLDAGMSWWGYGKIETARLGAQCVQWILTRRKGHNIRLIHTRNYVPKQTAFYAYWLSFQEDEVASQFLIAFPRFQIPNRLQQLQHKRQTIASRMDERLQREGFDIGKHPAEQRRAIAHRFIELDEKLRDIDEHCREIELAVQLSPEWMGNFDDDGNQNCCGSPAV